MNKNMIFMVALMMMATTIVAGFWQNYSIAPKTVRIPELNLEETRRNIELQKKEAEINHEKTQAEAKARQKQLDLDYKKSLLQLEAKKSQFKMGQ